MIWSHIVLCDMDDSINCGLFADFVFHLFNDAHHSCLWGLLWRIFMTLKNKQSCNGTAYGYKLIIKHRYLFLLVSPFFPLFPSIIGLEMLLFCCLSAKRKLYLWFIWYNTLDQANQVNVPCFSFQRDVTFPFPKPFLVVFFFTSDKINCERLTLSFVCEKILDFHAWLQL